MDSSDQRSSKSLVTQSSSEYSCVCGSVYKNKSSLVFHLKTHLEEKAIICHYCSKAFRNNLELEAHESYHTKKKLFICQRCGKECSTNSALKSHQITHMKRKLYKCDICNKIFSYYSSLKNHIQLHSVLKPFACGICSKTFKQQQLLTVHMTVHSSERPFECDTCGKKFAKKQMLQCHFAVHTGDKAFKCKECPKRFAHLSDALKHQKIHSGIKPFVCSLCPAKFLRKGHLTRHMKIHNKKPKSIEMKIEKESNLDNKKNEQTKLKNKLVKSKIEHNDKIKNNHKGDHRTIEIQFICNTLKYSDDEYVEITCKEELDSFVSELGEEKLWVSIGRENAEGSWEYEEVETTIVKVSGNSKDINLLDVDSSKTGPLNDNNKLTPWKCALCNSVFAKKLELIFHHSEEHRESLKPKSVGVKLAVNKTSGNVEEVPLARRQKFRTISKDLILPLYQKYFKKSVPEVYQNK